MTTATRAAKLKIPPFRERRPNGNMRLNFHPGQERVWDSLARFVFMMAGLQGGKTCFGPHWIHREMVEEVDRLEPGEPLGDYLAVSSTFSLLSQKMLPEILEVFSGYKWLNCGRWHSGLKILELTEGLVPVRDGGKFWAKRSDDPMYGRLLLRSADSESGLASATGKATWLDECGQPQYTLAAWREIVGRLSISKGRLLGTTTLYNHGWMKTQVFDRWRKGDPNYEVIQFDSKENPRFDDEEYERVRHEMAEWQFNMKYRGLYDKPLGLVYNSFDEEHDIIDPFDIPSHWPLLIGHDFGSANPVVLIYAWDIKNDIFFLVGEYSPGPKPVQEQVRTIREMVDELPEETKDRSIWRRAGGSHQEEDSRGNYGMHGWPILEPAVTGPGSVDVQISRVYALHARGGIKAFNTCPGYLAEKSSFSYKKDSDGLVSGNEIEHESRFHYMAAERYILCGFLSNEVKLGAPEQRRSNRFGARR